LAAPAGAHAQKGLHVDPHSPAGTEYAVPLDSGRQPGGGSGGGDPRFGAGITPPSHTQGSGSAGTTTAGSGGGGAGGSQDRGGSAGPGGTSKSGQAGASGRPAAAVSVPAPASYSSAGPLIALIAAILLAGCSLGLLARRRARSRQAE
jgi:hypothetical protein